MVEEACKIQVEKYTALNLSDNFSLLKILNFFGILYVYIEYIYINMCMYHYGNMCVCMKFDSMLPDSFSQPH